MVEDVESAADEQESKWAWVWPPAAALIALAFILLVLWANYEWKDWLVGVLPRQNAEIDSAEKFGAVFGFASAFFTGLAFVGLIYAIFLQRQEVKMAREALKQARDELKIAQDNQAALNAQLERQNREAEKNSFEDTFFKLLERFVQTRDGLRKNQAFRYSSAGPYSVNHVALEGVSVFSEICEEIKHFIISKKDRKEKINLENEVATAMKRNFKYVSQYFYMLDALSRYVTNNCPIQNSLYLDLFRSILSNDEIVVSYLNSFHGSRYPDGIIVGGLKLVSLLEARDVILDYSEISKLFAEKSV